MFFPMHEKPMGLALVVCDQIMTEVISGKHTLVGVSNNLFATRFPCHHPALCVFALLSNGQGRMKVVLRCVHAESGHEVVRLDEIATFQDPNQVIELKFVMRNLQFPEAGIYSVELTCDSEHVIESRLTIRGAKKSTVS